MTTRCLCVPLCSDSPTAIATLSAVSGVIGSLLAVPRMPSVPNNLRAIAPVLPTPLPHPDKRRAAGAILAETDAQIVSRRAEGAGRDEPQTYSFALPENQVRARCTGSCV